MDQELLEDREKEIFEINRKAVILNEIMKDLAVMVNEQGSPIKEVSQNTQETRENATKALEEIKKNEDKESYCCLFFGLFFC